jgi:hypothetical protein
VPEAVNFIQHRGGHIIWLTKDIRSHDITRHSRAERNIDRHYSSSSSVVSEDPENAQLAVQQFLNSFGDEVDRESTGADDIMGVPLSSSSLAPFAPPPNLPQLHKPPSESSIPSSIASYSSANFGLPPAPVPLPFSKLLRHLSRPSLTRPIFVSFSLQAMNTASCPGVYVRSSNGLTVEEALEICSASGSDPNVSLLLTHLSPLSCV